MPSGSHGGGGGSHGGGSHGGGGSHFGGGSRGGYSQRGPMRIRFGRTHYVIHMRASRCISFLVVLLFFAFFGIFTTAVLKSSAGSSIRSIEQDYIYYQDMVAYAKQYEDHQIEGTVITKYYKQSYDKWYVTYYFMADDGSKVEGYTFSVYTFEEAQKFRAGDKILLAVDGTPTNSDTDSVPMDYGDMPIEKDGEYTMFLSQRHGAHIGLIVCCSVAGGIVVIAALTAYFNKVKVQEHNTTSSSTKTNSEVENGGSSTKPAYCQYCGAELENGKKKCNNCGAKQQN